MYFSKSIKGRDKAGNDDNLLIIDEPLCAAFFIFDGVGGSLNGRKATEVAIDYIKSKYKDHFSKDDYDSVQLFLDVNKHILDSGVNDALTTICCCIILYGKEVKYVISNLGDTRAYSFDFRSLKQISVDDRVSSKSNVITKCLGMRNLSGDDVHKVSLMGAKMNVLLCTDGFYGLLEKNLMTFLKDFNSKNIRLAKRRIDKSIKDQNLDDATYILIFNQ